MAQVTKTFRIFVSSTFSDLKEERNALQERVFPRLRELCRQHGARFQAIDLRWGVSEEASLDQQTMNICLGEIARCQRTTPRPNFIVLLGDRYGWCPPPPQIPASEFGEILRRVADEDRKLLNAWYRRDDNAVPPEYRLRPRQRRGEYDSYEAWASVEAGLHAVLTAAEGMNLDEDRRRRYLASATEQEIAYGALRVEDAPEHVLCFFRTLQGLPRRFSAKDFLATVDERLREEFEESLENPSAEDWLQELRQLPSDSSAKDFDERLQELLKKSPQGNPAEELLSAVRRWLSDFTARDFQDLEDQTWNPDGEARTRQDRLRERLQAHVSGNIQEYQAHWTGRGASTDHIDKLCEDVYSSLSHVILEEIRTPRGVAPTPGEMVHIQPNEALDDDGLAHHRFAEERLRVFVGRTDILGKIGDYIKGTDRRSLAIIGEGGTGKSALLAKAIQQAQAAHPGKEIVYRFIGATPDSSDGRSLLDSLCREVSRRYRSGEAGVPADYRELVPEFGKRLELATADRPLILFLDALDQLSVHQEARNLAWLPVKLPEHVRVVVSTRPGESLDHLQAKQPQREELGPMSPAEGDELLGQWLAGVSRTLQKPQRQEVLDKFVQSQGRPLYLKLAFEEACRWTSDAGEPPEKLEPGITGIVERNLLDRLAQEGNHGEVLVSQALGYLAASRYGLAEDELLDLLSRDPQVYDWFLGSVFHLPPDVLKWAKEYRRSHKTCPVKEDKKSHPDEDRAAGQWLEEVRASHAELEAFLAEVLPKADGPRLPVVLWSRLSFDLEPYVTERLAEGSALTTFYHRELGDVATQKYLGSGKDRDYHERLAAYFRFIADPSGHRSWEGNRPRGLSELPYHLTRATRWDELHDTLTDVRFLEHKAAEVGVIERIEADENVSKTYMGALLLRDDFELALKESPTQIEQSEHRLTLAAFSRALRREAHNLLHRPDMLWQQMYNRLQWEGEPVSRVLESERARRSEPGASPWMKTRTPPHESESLIRTLTGHRSPVTSCAISPDGSIIVSASNDWTLKVWDAATGQERATLTGHKYILTGCAISPDNCFIVSASADYTLKVWDAATGRERATLIGHTSPVRACAISPDGRFIVSASEDKTLKAWNPATGQERATLAGHTGQVYACAINADSRFIVSVSKDNTLKVWDAATGKERVTLAGHTGQIRDCAISPTGGFIVSASDDKTLKVWDAATGKKRMTLTGHTDWVLACAISPDGRFIVSASRDGTLKVWDAATGKERATLTGHKAAVRLCVISPNGDFIVSASMDNTLKVWDATTGQERTTLVGHGSDVRSCVISRDSRFIVSASGDGTLKVWDTAASQEHATRTGHSGTVCACAISPDGGFIVSASEDKTLKVWDAPTGKERTTLVGHTDEVNDCVISPDGHFIVSASEDKTLKVWNAATGQEQVTLTGHTDKVFACAISPDGRFVVSASRDATLKVWDAATGQENASLAAFGHQRVYRCAISPDGRFIVSANLKTLQVWDVATGQERATVGHADNILDCAISPDGGFIVSASMDKTLKVWDMITGNKRVNLTGHTNWVKACAISPDGRFIVSASDDKTLKVWDVATGQERATLGHTAAVNACAISPDGRFIISASSDKTLKVWVAATGQERASLPLLGGGWSLALHPWLPFLTCGETGGQFDLVDLVGIQYGPLIVTPVERGSGLEAGCPACRQVFQLMNEGLGREMTCPQPGCNTRLRVNPFVVKYPASGHG